MKNRIKNKKGFTLIELVMVIVILGILAAVAIPRFVDLKGDAKIAVRDGVTGALAGQITMSHADFLVNNNDYTITSIVNSIDATGVDSFAPATGTSITGDIGGTTYTWTYQDKSGNVAAKITGVSP